MTWLSVVVRRAGGRGGWYVSRMGLSPRVVVSWSGHSTIIVREFCFVKCESVDSVSGRSILANRGQSMPEPPPKGTVHAAFGCAIIEIRMIRAEFDCTRR